MAPVRMRRRRLCCQRPWSKHGRALRAALVRAVKAPTDRSPAAPAPTPTPLPKTPRVLPPQAPLPTGLNSWTAANFPGMAALSRSKSLASASTSRLKPRRYADHGGAFLRGRPPCQCPALGVHSDGKLRTQGSDTRKLFACCGHHDDGRPVASSRAVGAVGAVASGPAVPNRPARVCGSVVVGTRDGTASAAAEPQQQCAAAPGRGHHAHRKECGAMQPNRTSLGDSAGRSVDPSLPGNRRGVSQDDSRHRREDPRAPRRPRRRRDLDVFCIAQKYLTVP